MNSADSLPAIQCPSGSDAHLLHDGVGQNFVLFALVN